MIEDKEIGLKVAENPTEARWIEIKKRAANDIISENVNIVIATTLLKLADSKIAEFKK